MTVNKLAMKLRCMAIANPVVAISMYCISRIPIRLPSVQGRGRSVEQVTW